MNFSRLSLAAAVAWLAYVGFGLLLYESLLKDLWMREAGLFRPLAEMQVGLVLGSSLLGLFVFTYVYAKGYEGGDGLQEGLRFGVLVGLLLVCFGTTVGYATMPLSGRLALYLTVATVLELGVSGVVVGWIYRPDPASRRRALAGRGSGR